MLDSITIIVISTVNSNLSVMVSLCDGSVLLRTTRINRRNNVKEYIPYKKSGINTNIWKIATAVDFISFIGVKVD